MVLGLSSSSTCCVGERAERIDDEAPSRILLLESTFLRSFLRCSVIFFHRRFLFVSLKKIGFLVVGCYLGIVLLGEDSVLEHGEKLLRKIRYLLNDVFDSSAEHIVL